MVIPSSPAASPPGVVARCLVALTAAKARELGPLRVAVHAGPAFAAYCGNDIAEWLLWMWSRSKLDLRSDDRPPRTQFFAREAGPPRVQFLSFVAVGQAEPATHDGFALRPGPCVNRLSG